MRKLFAASILTIVDAIIRVFVGFIGPRARVPFFGLGLVLQLSFWLGLHIAIIIFAILSLILVATSKREFS